MQDILINMLLEYIRENNPDVLHELESEGRLMPYLTEKISSTAELVQQLQAAGQPVYSIEQNCMEVLTKDLRPSKYNYICNILEEEFETEYNRLLQSGLLLYEVINMITRCQSVFQDLKFSEENEDNRFLRYAIAGAIIEYLESNRESENVSNELQQSTETEG